MILRELRYDLAIRPSRRCDCEGKCAYCREFGHSACWRKVALWRRLKILWKERHG